jgi:hypothetical protein
MIWLVVVLVVALYFAAESFGRSRALAQNTRAALGEARRQKWWDFGRLVMLAVGAVVVLALWLSVVGTPEAAEPPATPNTPTPVTTR